MIHVLLTSELPWKRDDATLFTCLCISRYQEFTFFQKSLKGACTSFSCLDYDKVWANSMRAFSKYFNKVLRVRKTLNEHAIDRISYYLKKTIRSETDAVSSYSSLISSESLHEKRGRLRRLIARKKNLIRLRSAAFFTFFECNLVHVYKSLLAVRKYM